MSGVDTTGGWRRSGGAHFFGKKHGLSPRRHGGTEDGSGKVNGTADGLHHGGHGEHGERRNLANGLNAKVKSKEVFSVCSVISVVRSLT